MNNQIVNVINFKKKYGKDTVLDEININLVKGKIYGFIGENGAGKTTLMRILTGLSQQTSGEYHLFCKKDKDKQKGRTVIGGIIEGTALILELTAYQNMKHKMILNNINDESIIKKLLSS